MRQNRLQNLLGNRHWSEILGDSASGLWWKWDFETGSEFRRAIHSKFGLALQQTQSAFVA
jgi:hypothetical protein